jgi:translation initiation factor IF-3
MRLDRNAAGEFASGGRSAVDFGPFCTNLAGLPSIEWRRRAYFALQLWAACRSLTQCSPAITTSSKQQRSYPIRRPMRAPAPVQKEGPRVNDEIRSREVQLIDDAGHNHGVKEFREAIAMAQEAGLDLVEIAPNSTPPVCKIMDFGKYKFQAQKKAAEARKKQKVVEVKEIKLRPMIDDHDYDVKMRAMMRFFEEGDKVKVTLRFRGREMAHQELGQVLLNRVKGDTTNIAKVEQEPKYEGRQIVMVLAPR